MSLKPNGESRKFVFLGCGPIGKLMVKYINQYFPTIEIENIIFVNDEEFSPKAKMKYPLLSTACFYKLDLRPGDCKILFNLLRLQPYDVIVDLISNSISLDIEATCKEMSLILINTNHIQAQRCKPFSSFSCQSFWSENIALQPVATKIIDIYNATHIYFSGVNFGLVSHFVFYGLIQMAEKIVGLNASPDLRAYIEDENYSKIAQYLNLDGWACDDFVDLKEERVSNLGEDNLVKFLSTEEYSPKGKIEKIEEFQARENLSPGILLAFKRNPFKNEEQLYYVWVGSNFESNKGVKNIKNQRTAINMLIALKYATEYPDKGCLSPENLPNEYIMKQLTPFLNGFFLREIKPS